LELTLAPGLECPDRKVGTTMVSEKTPSSLDYETLLHELALKNWRLALLARDFPRALSNAEKLARSRDRFWRWQGLLDVATTRLCLGDSTGALAALGAGRECYPDVPELRAPAAEIEAHILLESGRAEEALHLTRSEAPDASMLPYLRALAFARMFRAGEALEVAGALPSLHARWGHLLESHVRAEVALVSGRYAEAADFLVAALATFADVPGRDSTIASSPGVILLHALGVALDESARREEALAVFEDMRRLEEALLYWPIPLVRSHYRRGRILAARGERAGALDAFTRFLTHWSRGDLDRDRVEEALQFVKA
jgi:tetratricopeptide (TPR) repeat protein